MRRAIPLAMLTACLAAGSASAGTDGRTVERAYETVETSPTFPQGGIRSSSSTTFRPRGTENAVMVTIEDESGLTVPAAVRQDLDGDGTTDTNHDFCGSTTDPVAIEPGVALKVVRFHGTCDGLTDPTQLGGWTTGTVTATFSTGPKTLVAEEPPHH